MKYGIGVLVGSNGILAKIVAHNGFENGGNGNTNHDGKVDDDLWNK